MHTFLEATDTQLWAKYNNYKYRGMAMADTGICCKTSSGRVVMAVGYKTSITFFQ